jgi:hypothetical protein
MLHYRDSKRRSTSGMKYTVSLEAGKTYQAKAIISDDNNKVSYKIIEE